MRRLLVLLPIVGLAAAASSPPLWAGPSGGPPNVVFILVDDLGYAELGCYGNRFNETPHVDRLAANGLRFTNAYAAAPVCSPTRAAFLTGQWPARVGITDYLRADDARYLDRKHVTIAERLKEAGYATGLIGKWHLMGDYRRRPGDPRGHGLDEVICSESAYIGPGYYWPPYRHMPEVKPRRPDEYLVDRLNEEAVAFIRRHKDAPFFLYKSHYAVHTRLAGKPALVAKYEAKPGAGRGHRAPRNNPHLAAQLECIDAGVGMIVEELRRLGILEETIIIFTSDNGGEDRVTTNEPLRAGKSTLYEGGIRVPLVIHWPAAVRPGTCDVPVTTVDFYPTLLDAAALAPDPRQTLDGISLLPLLKDPTGAPPERALYWHYPLEKPHFLGGRSSGAVRRGRLKLIEFFDDGHRELYDVQTDPAESRDLSRSLPAEVRRLAHALAAWRRQVGAQTPGSTSAKQAGEQGRR